MNRSTGAGKIAAFTLAAAILVGLSGCESGPDIDRLAPKMPKLRAEVPESSHPEIPKDQFPNINNAPDRPSVLRSEEELESIEDSLEDDGKTHVKQKVGLITGEITEADIAKAESETPASAPAQTTIGSSSKPLDLTPVE